MYLRESLRYGAVALALAALSLWAAEGSARAPAGRYEVVSGTVKDRQTGLTWQRDAGFERYTWEAAKARCQSMGTGWRLPALKELLTLVDPTTDHPAIDTIAFPNTDNFGYWTASPYVFSGRAWKVHFSYGDSAHYDISDGNCVRCVR